MDTGGEPEATGSLTEGVIPAPASLNGGGRLLQGTVQICSLVPAAVIVTLSAKGGDLNEEPHDGSRNGGLDGGAGASELVPHPDQANHGRDRRQDRRRLKEGGGPGQWGQGTARRRQARRLGQEGPGGCRGDQPEL